MNAYGSAGVREATSFTAPTSPSPRPVHLAAEASVPPIRASPSPEPVNGRSPYRPDIEGLRALAILVVVAFHAGLAGFSGGFVGVDVFFVLSGYLITGLLVEEASRTGRIDLAQFYARRTRRLLPAVAVVLGVTLVATAVLYAPFEQRFLVRTWLMTALYVSNVHFAQSSLDYHGPDAATNPLLHTWSLSVEEQFYLVWPWLVLAGLGMLVGRRSDHRASPAILSQHAIIATRLCAVLGTVTAASFTLSLGLTRGGSEWAFYLMPTRMWEFGIGGLAAILPLRESVAVRRLLAWAALAALAAAVTTFGHTTRYPGIAALVPVLATGVLLRAGAPDPRGPCRSSWSATSVLARGPLLVIGRLSYSWYLWHWPALVFATALARPLPQAGRAIAVAVSLVLAIVSYRYVETPLRHGRALSLRPARSFAFAAGVALATGGASFVWHRATVHWQSTGVQASIAEVAKDLPQIYPDGCDHFGRPEVVQCAYGDTSARRTAILFGDSHAGHWFPAARIAAESAHVRLVVITLSACPFVAVPHTFDEKRQAAYPECDAWRRAALDTIARMRPDMVFVSSYDRYAVPSDVWGAGTSAVLGRLATHARRVVLLPDTPSPDFDVPACLARAAWRPGLLAPDCTVRGDLDPERIRRRNAELRAAHAVAGVEILDLSDSVCHAGTCAPTHAGLLRYRDDSHLGRAFAQTFVAPFLDRMIERPAGAHPTHERSAARRVMRLSSVVELGRR